MPVRRSKATPPLTWDQYAARWASLHGGVDPRRARPTVEGWLRASYEVARVCARLRLRPGAVAMAGLAVCVCVPLVAARGAGWAVLAAALVLLAAFADTVDGALAVLIEHTTRLGYVYDAVADRIGEILWLVALWRLGGAPVAAVAAGAMTLLHEYTRSRAGAAGMADTGTVTLGERPTRVAVTVVGLILAGLAGLGSVEIPRGIVTFAVVTWLVLTLIGYAQLFASVHRALAGRRWPSWRPQPMARIVPVSAPPAVPEPPAEPYPPDPELDEIAATMSPSTTVYTSESVLGTGPVGLNAVGFDDKVTEAEPDEGPAHAAPPHGRHVAARPEPETP